MPKKIGNLPFKYDEDYRLSPLKISSNKRERDSSPISSRLRSSKKATPSKNSKSSSRKRSITPDYKINYILSAHAVERMKERNITNEDIERILKNIKPEVNKTQNPFYEDVNVYKEFKPKEKDFELKVITSQDEIPKVITVIRNLNKKGGKTRKNKKSNKTKNSNKTNKNKIIKFINKRKSKKSRKIKVKKTKKI